jgi:hypothetical protein
MRPLLGVIPLLAPLLTAVVAANPPSTLEDQAGGQLAPSDGERQEISEFFSPPEKLAKQYGKYRTPLQFDDGRVVKTPAEWPKRRKQILKKWHGLMGNWPPLLEEQKLTFGDVVKLDGYSRHHVRFRWLPNEWTDGYLLIPDGNGPFPAVITVFYEPETAVGLGGKPHRDFALQLAKRGFATLSIGTREASRKKEYSLFHPSVENSEVQPLSLLAYAAANAWHALAKVPEVDAKRIGIMGHSFGGKWAMFASCLFEKFACAAWSDPGIVFDHTKGSQVNYWEPWYLGYHPPPWAEVWKKVPDLKKTKGCYPQILHSGSDLHELHALMAPRPFLVSGGSADPIGRWEALNHTVQVNRLLGHDRRVAMTNRLDHAPNEESNRLMCDFFDLILKKR